MLRQRTLLPKRVLPGDTATTTQHLIKKLKFGQNKSAKAFWNTQSFSSRLNAKRDHIKKMLQMTALSKPSHKILFKEEPFYLCPNTKQVTTSQ